MQRLRGLFRRRFVAFHQIAQFVLRAGIQQVDGIIFHGRMDPWLRRKHVAALRQGRVTQLFELVQRGYLRLEILLQILFGVGRDLPLRQVKTESGQRYYDDHYRGEQTSSKACYAFVSRLNCRPHGKSTRSVWPFFNSTAFSRVVLLSIQALSV